MRLELVPNQPEDWKLENLYYDVFESDGTWLGSRRLTEDEIAEAKNQLRANEGDHIRVERLDITLSEV